MSASGELDVMGVLIHLRPPVAGQGVVKATDGPASSAQDPADHADAPFVLGARIARDGVAFAHRYFAWRPELEQLLRDVEQQFHDFAHEVVWEVEAGLWLRWTLDARGYAIGSFVLRTPEGWLLRGPLRGDQSYLPQLALGLRVALGQAGPS